MTPPPLSRTADCGVIDAFSPDFSAFVFKIQANMNKAHRDRLAFLRICSGKYEREAEVFHVQGGRKLRLSQPQQLMAQEREIIDEAYAGDIIGVFDPGIFSIGDTITTPGKKFRFAGIPTFPPEHFSRVSPKDTMKRKQFVKGTEQIAQEGAIQIFKVPDTGMEEVIVGVVGTLQFDVFRYRMQSEYGVELRMEGLPYEVLRYIRKSPVEEKELNLSSDVELLEDYRGHKLLVFQPVGHRLHPPPQPRPRAGRDPAGAGYGGVRLPAHHGTPLTCHCEERSDVAISQYPVESQESSGENGTASPRLHPKGTSSRFALRAPRRPLASSQ